MDERENRDDIVRRVIKQRQQEKRRLMTAKEKAEIVRYVKTQVLPDAYRK